MDPLERLRRADAGLGALAATVRQGLSMAGQKSTLALFDKLLGAVATRITAVERERDNLYALSASRFDRAELDSVIQATRKQ